MLVSVRNSSISMFTFEFFISLILELLPSCILYGFAFFTLVSSKYFHLQSELVKFMI